MALGEFSLYILRCADDSLYTGIAADVERRVAEHCAGARGAKYLRGRLPLTLEYVERVGDRAAAQRFEHRVKRLTRARKELLISGQLTLRDLLVDQGAEADSGSATTVP